MKSASPALIEQLKNASSVKALPEVTVDWNLNRYHDTRVDNVPNEQDAGYDIEIFPVESITEPLRPAKGINKARIGQSVVSREYYDESEGPDSRFYIADVNDTYKYWTSPKPAVGGVMPLFNTTNFPTAEYIDLTGHDNQTSARPFVEYGDWDEAHENFTAKTVPANKIIVQFENTWATPNDFSIIITRASGTMEVADSDLPSGWEGSGRVTLYWNGSTWTANGTRMDNSVTGFPAVDRISKIQVEVRTLRGGYQKTKPGEPLVRTKYRTNTGAWVNTDGSDSFLDIIEIGAHLEADITPWVMSVEDTSEIADASSLYPIGTVTSNQANMTLTNIYEASDGSTRQGIFSRNNSDDEVVWSEYIDANAEVSAVYAFYSDEDDDEPYEKIQQMVMFTDIWSGQTSEEVSVPLTDYTKFFNDITVNAAMWENLKVPEIIWRILDSIGYGEYVVERGAATTEHVIPVFYTDGEQSVWEVLEELAKASQSAIYVDSHGILRVKTREYALSPTDAPVWEFNANNTASQKANLVSLEQITEYEPNSIKVVYQKTDWSAFNKGMPAMQKVWEPEAGSVVLRSTQLVRNLNMGDRFFRLDPKDSKVWPYSGIVNIQGELIRYEGKEFVYFAGSGSGTMTTTVIKSEDERVNVQRNLVASGQQHRSYFTGAIAIARDEYGALERGYWNSEARDHSVDANGYNVRNITGGVRKTDVNGFKHLKQESKVLLQSNGKFEGYRDLLIATRGQTDDNAFFHYGTKMSFVKESGLTTQRAGLVIHNSGTSEDGYYIEFTPSSKLGGEERKNRQEMIVYSRVGGNDKRLGQKALAIAEGIEFEVDVTYINVPNSTDHKIQVWVNGKNVFNERISGAQRNAANGKFGVFLRGKTKAQYEFLYAVRREGREPADDFSFLDRVERGYMGDRWQREWVFNTKTYKRRVKKKWRKAQKRQNRMFFDDFGPYAHEVREFDVKFDPSPVLHSRLFLTNDWSAAVVEYSADPFGAKFVLSNTARHNSVIHGDDSISFKGTNDSVSQVLTVLGRALIIDEAEEILVENVDQIRRRGKNEAELSSPWIQSEAMAKDVADWIRNNFTYGNETISVEVFGNPLIEVGDVVRVEYPEKHISGDYFVMTARNNFQEGLSTDLELRRRV